MKYKNIDRRIYSEEEVKSLVYLKRYEKKYKVDQNPDGTFEIVCKSKSLNKPLICVYNFPIKENGNNILMFTRTLDSGSKNTNLLKRKLKSKGIECTMHQEANFGECSILFPEKDLEKVEDIFGIKKRKKLSPEHLEKLRERAKKNFRIKK